MKGQRRKLRNHTNIGWGLVFLRAQNFYHLIDSAVTTNFYCFNMSLNWPLLPIFIPFPPQISLSAHYVRAVRDPREQAQGTHNTHVQAPQSAHVHMCTHHPGVVAPAPACGDCARVPYVESICRMSSTCTQASGPNYRCRHRSEPHASRQVRIAGTPELPYHVTSRLSRGSSNTSGTMSRKRHADVHSLLG